MSQFANQRLYRGRFGLNIFLKKMYIRRFCDDFVQLQNSIGESGNIIGISRGKRVLYGTWHSSHKIKENLFMSTRDVMVLHDNGTAMLSTEFKATPYCLTVLDLSKYYSTNFSNEFFL